MKGVKGKLLKKLQTIKTIGYLKPERILQVSASDGFFDALRPKQHSKVEEEEPKIVNQSSIPVQEPEIIDVSELMRDLEDEEMAWDDDINDKENCIPEIQMKDPVVPKENSGDRKHKAPLSEIDISSFRPPDLNSGTLFDPNLLAAFEQAVMEVKAQEAQRRTRIGEQNAEVIEEEPPSKARKIEETASPVLEFQEKCPPGGKDSVIFYTTGIRGIRKTFEDCTSIRFLLESFKVSYIERDVSMHSEFREELWRILGGKELPPKLFIKGRHIGGAEEVLRLHEQGKLRPLFDGIPLNRSEGPCDGCAGVRFVMCCKCNGSRKIAGEGDGVVEKCSECNENGVVICPICC
ncbi:hypothetical protein RJ640_001330 [Escallonia rubra]|uniref:Glutaredoxin domain-containing protein n=1 Tax=Escallonia rubra TaxID=112253 RepID=A0AA88QTH1_9ASTE|nr:hypothetical protein RJ640_001330 [Escallonia rubra]